MLQAINVLTFYVTKKGVTDYINASIFYKYAHIIHKIPTTILHTHYTHTVTTGVARILIGEDQNRKIF